jgi:hypothetical protein
MVVTLVSMGLIFVLLTMPNVVVKKVLLTMQSTTPDLVGQSLLQSLSLAVSVTILAEIGRVTTVALKLPRSVWIPPPPVAAAVVDGLGVCDGFGVGEGDGEGTGDGLGDGCSEGEGEGVDST